jgi:pimeloyl-ACP methyl ester carboxylesterase
MSDVPNDASLKTVRAGGRVFTVRDAGDPKAPALVLLHGIGSGSASWAAQLESLPAQGLRVVAWDAPGYGGSDPLPMAAPLAADYAAALDELLAALDIDLLGLVGHSLGALTAAAFTSRNERRVAKLVLASPAAGYGSATEEVRKARTEGRLVDMERYGPAGVAERRAHALLSPAASPEAVAKVRAVMAQLRPDGYRQAVAMLAGSDIFAEKIMVPILVLCGSADTVTPEGGCRRVAASIGARYETLSGLGHASYVENPPLFDAALLRFLEESSE